MRLREDEGGAIQVFEAVLVALLVLSTLLIINALQRPTTGGEVGGVDLARLSDDTLEILQSRNFTDPSSGIEYDFAGWVGAVMDGETDLAREVDAFLDEVLPLGAQYQLRIDNGVDHLRLLPPGLDRQPLAARAATTYIFPDWRVYNASTPGSITVPGAPLDWSLWLTLRSPAGSDTGPDGEKWIDIWEEEIPGSKDTVPMSAPLGIWRYTDVGACAGGCHIQVASPGGATLERPLYAIHLVVWYGA